MKTVLFACILVASVGFASGASAQVVGLLGGTSMSHTSSSYDGGGGSVVGHRSDITGGLFLQLPIAGDVLGEIGANFITKGDGDHGASLALRYAEIPILLHLAPHLSDTRAVVRPFISAGPSVAFLLSCSVPHAMFSCHDETFYTRSVEVAAVGGVGVEWWTPERTSLGVEARFSRSVTNTGLSMFGKRVNNTVELLGRIGGIL